MNKKLTFILIGTFLLTVCFFEPPLLPLTSADVASNPVVTIAFDDGRSSQYQHAYPLMKARGITGTFYITANFVKDISGDYTFMSFSEILDLQNAGNEIGSHSLTHSSFTSLTETQMRDECLMSKSVLEAHGLRVENFAYPYGSTNDFVDSIVSQYFRSARTAYTAPYIMSLPTSQFRLTAFAGETGDSNALPRLKNILDQLTANQWIIIFFHKIEPNVSDQPNTISTKDFEKFLDYIVLKGIKTLTVSQALGLKNLSITTNPSGLTPQPIIAPPGPWYDNGTLVNCTAQTVSGYTFGHWTVDGTNQGQGVNPITVTMSEPHTAIAHYLVRDIAVTNVTPSKTVVGQSYSLSINVTVENQGDPTETFNVTVYANTTIIATVTNVTLTSGNSTTIAFMWNTTGFAKGVYTISATATTVPGETDTGDNSFTDGTVRVNMVGDLKSDGKVTITDIVIIALAFGSAPEDDPETPWDETENWNPNADINDDGKVTISDVVIAALHFGEEE